MPGPYSFPTRITGGVIAPSHLNDLQTAVTQLADPAIYHVHNYGAPGSWDAVIAAAAAASGTGGVVQLEANTTYHATSPLTLTWPGDFGVTIRGYGPSTVIEQAYYPGGFEGLIEANGAYTDANVTTLTDNADSTDNTLTVASTASLTVGAYYLLGSDAAFANAPASTSHDELRYRGELVRIASIDSGTQVTLKGLVRDDYLTSDGASLKAIDFMRGVAFEHFKIVNPEPDQHTGGALKLQYVEDFRIAGVTCEGIDGVGIHLDMCRQGNITDCRMINLTDNIAQNRYGYGIDFDRATEDVVVSNLVGEGGRHLITTNGVDNKRGVPRNITIIGGVSNRSHDTAWDTHAQGADISFIGCSATNCATSAFTIRSRDTHVIGCRATYCNKAVTIQNPSSGAQVIGCTFRKIFGGSGRPIEIAAVYDAVIADNTIDGAFASGIMANGGGEKIWIVNNRILNIGQLGGAPAIEITSGALIKGVVILNNLLADFTVGLNEPRAAGNMTYPVVLAQTGSGNGHYVVGNQAIGASQTTFVNDAGTGNTKRRNDFLDTALPTYTVSNVTTDRTYDADATTTAELADALGTLIADLRAKGIVS